MLHLLIPVLIIVSMAMLALAVRQLFTGKQSLKAGSCMGNTHEEKNSGVCSCGLEEYCNNNIK
jgi:hypothetical protein